MNMHDEIATVANELHETKGRIHAYDLSDWLESEKTASIRYAGQDIEEPEEEEDEGMLAGYDFDDWQEAEKIVLIRRAGQDMEEPEEEQDENLFAGVAVGASKEIFAPRKGSAEESEDTSINEEMS